MMTDENNGSKEIEALLSLSKQETSVKQKRRYDAVLLFLEGYARKEIAKVLHIPERTVSNHIEAYQKGGKEALLLKKHTGAPRKLTEAQEADLAERIENQTPEEAGIGIFANWTAPLVCRLVEKTYHVTFSERGMRDLLYRIGFSYTRPTYTLKKADPEKQQKFREDFETVKKNSCRTRCRRFCLRTSP